ncbi:MAG TPA: cellulase family glycosylhydrolase [Bacteroidia bacterium]|jgi:hypothetical protein|nr:cellulase family glycosylhydrolase [Bacteroidia bacterium]
MKRFSFFAIVFVAGLTSAFAQYFTLQGNTFMLNGSAFYPVTCGYTYEIAYDSASPNTPYLTPSHGYGKGSAMTVSGWPNPNWDFDCDGSPACSTQIVQDMKKIKSMGFNSIRTNFGVIKSDTLFIGVNGFVLKPAENTHPGPTNIPANYIYINPPYNSSNTTLVNKVLPFYDLILQTAQQAGLYVFLDIGYGHIGNTASDATDYANFLSYFAARYSTNTTLAAYVMLEEPASEITNPNIRKIDVCNYTKQWYDAIKAADANHLISISGYGAGDVYEWDPGIMKMDFYSPHIYPFFRDYETSGAYPTGYDFQKGYNRVLGNLIWLNHNCPVPWLIGETSFSSIDDSGTPTSGLGPLSPPYDDGSFQEQSNYATNLLNDVRNSGGIGFTWWAYQENWDVPLQNLGDGYGLLKHGAMCLPCSTILNHDPVEKQVVQAFRNYPNPAPPPGTQPTLSSTNYTDPFNFYFYTPSSPYVYTGTVIDANTSQPIKDAIIFGFTHWASDPQYPTTANSFTVAELPYTFSDVNGNFTLYVYHPGTYVDNSTASKSCYVNNIAITAIGAEKYNTGWSTTTLPANSLGTISLHRSSLTNTSGGFNTTISNQTISGTQNYSASNSLTINNTSEQNGSTASFTAKDFLHIVPGTTASSSIQGSNVHFYISQVFEDCNDFASYTQREISSNSSPSVLSGEELELQKKDIEIDFRPNKQYAYLTVKPNPNNGIFVIELIDNKTGQNSDKTVVSSNVQLPVDITVYSMTGSKVYNGIYGTNTVKLDLSFLISGMYYLQVKNGSNIFNQKIIIQ